MRTFLLVLMLVVLTLLCGDSFVVRAKAAALMSRRCAYTSGGMTSSPVAAPTPRASALGGVPVPSSVITLGTGIALVRVCIAMRRDLHR